MNTQKTSPFSQLYLKGHTYRNVLDKRATWEEFSKMYTGSLKASTTKSGDVTTLSLEIKYQQHTIVLRETDTQPLKAAIQLNLIDKSEFTVYQKDWTDRISSFFGIKSAQTGEKAFDERYGILLNKKGHIPEMLNDSHILKKIVENKVSALSLHYNKNTNTHSLLTVIDRNTNEVKALTDLIELEFQIVDSFIKHRPQTRP